MDKLSDEIVFRIINDYFTINERVELRCINKKFKQLVDSICIVKLVIYNKLPQVPGRFRLINENFNLKDTVYVFDLNEFFNNQAILSCIKSIKKVNIS